MTEATYSSRYFAKRAASPLFSWEVELLGNAVEGKRVLEVGCGAGELGRRLLTRSPVDYVGTDIIKQPGGAPSVLCGADALPFDANSFDIVLSQHVVEHLVEPLLFFVEAHRVLAAGGILRFTTPNPRYRDSSIFEDPTHVSVHDVDSWADSLKSCGFTVSRAVSYFPYLGHPILLYTSARLTRVTRRTARRGAVIFVEGVLQ